ncbi:MAG: hypothetical protein NZM25_08025 [Leptospiraceae bacterium]|nr:hypothetical protein [Leptospiraceae bacterium]MDW8305548.1 hypothetical protein [Leptospiraceae bacterium]
MWIFLFLFPFLVGWSQELLEFYPVHCKAHFSEDVDWLETEKESFPYGGREVHFFCENKNQLAYYRQGKLVGFLCYGELYPSARRLYDKALEQRLWSGPCLGALSSSDVLKLRPQCYGVYPKSAYCYYAQLIPLSENGSRPSKERQILHYHEIAFSQIAAIYNSSGVLLSTRNPQELDRGLYFVELKNKNLKLIWRP